MSLLLVMSINVYLLLKPPEWEVRRLQNVNVHVDVLNLKVDVLN